MSDRFEKMFEKCRAENRKALIVYATCGCPTAAESEIFIENLIKAGADAVELGVPFSDPTADGPTIQTAGQKALAAGIKLADILAMASRLRGKHPDTPFILFSYFNVMLNYGLEKLVSGLESAGVDAILAVDLAFEERGELLPLCEKHGLALIPLLSPATGSDRAAAIADGMHGFAYCVTVRGVTGARSSLPAGALDDLARFRKVAHGLPLAAGFGISNYEMAAEAATGADAVVVGSALMKPLLSGDFSDGLAAGVELTRNLAAAVRRA